MQSQRAFFQAGRTSPVAFQRLPRRSVKVCANMCPYSTLGVNASASDNEVKQAYRKLVLQYHPDVNHAQGAERKFMSIQQAYELLTGKARAEGPDGRRSDWAFHDWYWSFLEKRNRKRWSSTRRGAAAAAADEPLEGEEAGMPPHKQPEHQATLRSQLAGLRHRAAIRARQQRNKPAADDSTTSSSDDDDCAGLEYDSSQMSDGCNMASGITDWDAAEAQHAAAAAQRRFSATESHRRQVMQQVAGLHRRAAASQEVW